MDVVMDGLATIQLQVSGATDGMVDFHFRADSQGDRGVISQIFVAKDYDLSPFLQSQPLARYVERIAQSGAAPLILDAGANIGASALYFAMCFPQARIVAVEPEPRNCALLRLNAEKLNVEVVEGAIGCEAGTMFLTDPGISDWGFRVEAVGERPVAVLPPAELMARAGAGTVPFLCKIDIEGGEANLFSRDVAWIDQFPLMIIELHDWLLPGQGNSRNFIKAISSFDFDFLFRGENAFCFNNRLLREFY